MSFSVGESESSWWWDIAEIWNNVNGDVSEVGRPQQFPPFWNAGGLPSHSNWTEKFSTAKRCNIVHSSTPDQMEEYEQYHSKQYQCQQLGDDK